MWNSYRKQLLPLIFIIGFNLLNVHTDEVQNKNDGPSFSTDLSEILNLFDTMVRETSINIESSVIPSCSVQTTDVDKSSNSSPAGGSLRPHKICVTSKEEFDEVWNALQEDEAKGVALIIVTSPNCTELDKIQIGILKLKSSFMEIMKHQVSSAKYEELKASYKEKLRNFRKQVDDVNVTYAEAEIIVKLQEELQKERDLVKLYLNKIEECQNTINEAFVRQVVDEIDRKEFASALQVFNVKITNKSQIKRIISSAYNGTDSIFFKVLPFLRGVNDSEGILLGYTALYDEMKSKNELDGFNALLITLEVFKKQNREQNAVNFKGLVESLTDTLKELHNNNGFDSFYQFAKNYDFIKEILSIFVQVGFDDNIANTQKMLDLMPKFDKLLHKIYLLSDLISELKVSYLLTSYLKVSGRTINEAEYTPEMFVMVYNVIQLRRSISEDDDQFTRHAIIELENNIPDVLRDLMFQNLCIQNSHDGSYLYAGDTTDENGRLVLTSNSSVKYGKALSWQIEFIDSGHKVLFKNEKYNEVLYILETGYPREARLLRPENLKNDVQAQFVIELQNNNWNAFGMFSPKYNQYLDVSDLSDGGTRKVLATVVAQYEEFEHVVAPKQMWIIKSCRLPV